MPVNLKKSFVLPAGQSDFTNLNVRVRVSGSNNPTRLYSASGSLMAKNGVATIDEDGSMDVWVASGLLFKLELFNITNQFVYQTLLNVDPTAPDGMSQAQSSQLAALYQSGLDSGTVVSPATSFTMAINELEVTLSALVLQNASTATLTSVVDWGDGNPPEDTTDLQTTSVAHTYAEGGTYSVSVRAKNNSVLGAPAVQPLTLATPVVEISLSVSKIDNDPTRFVVYGNYNTGDVIDWGDGGPTTTIDDWVDSYHVYTGVGPYVVTATGKNEAGDVVAFGTVTFSTTDSLPSDGNSPFGASFMPNDPTRPFLTGSTVQFTDSSANADGSPITSWLWDFGDGGTSTLQNPAHTFTNEAGTSLVSLAVNGGDPTAVNLQFIDRPTLTETPLFADGFGGTGTVNDRVPDTAWIGFMDKWESFVSQDFTQVAGRATNLIDPETVVNMNTAMDGPVPGGSGMQEEVFRCKFRYSETTAYTRQISLTSFYNSGGISNEPIITLSMSLTPEGLMSVTMWCNGQNYQGLTTMAQDTDYEIELGVTTEMQWARIGGVGGFSLARTGPIDGLPTPGLSRLTFSGVYNDAFDDVLIASV
jgi:PKD repeat protein